MEVDQEFEPSADSDFYSSPIHEPKDDDFVGIGGRVVSTPKRPKASKKQPLKKKVHDDDAEDMACWSPAKRHAWESLDSNPNAFYYRHVAPGVKKRTGVWTEKEKKLFMEAVKLHPPSQGKWGLFAMNIPGRVGYQCRNFYHRLLETGELKEDFVETPKPSPKKKKATRKRKEVYESDEESESIDIYDEDEFSDGKISFDEGIQNEGEQDLILVKEEEKQVPMKPEFTPKMQRPWDRLPKGTKFVSFPHEEPEPPKIENFESSNILRYNSKHPTNLLLLTFPVPSEKVEAYMRVVRNRLATNVGQEPFERQLAEIFRIQNLERKGFIEDLDAEISRFADNIINEWAF